MIRTIALVSCIAVALTSCVTTDARIKAGVVVGKSIKQICDNLPPITYDGKLDTQLTKDQIRQYNARRDALCK